jgi:hypothetical protein
MWTSMVLWGLVVKEYAPCEAREEAIELEEGGRGVWLVFSLASSVFQTLLIYLCLRWKWAIAVESIIFLR